MVLEHSGAESDYDTIMGDTGQAFIIQSEEGGPLIDGAVDVGWWPMAAWGLKLRLEFLGRTVGREVRELLTEFGLIDLLWCDFSYTKRGPEGKGRKDWQSEKLYKLVRELAPALRRQWGGADPRRPPSSRAPHGSPLFDRPPTRGLA